ncbi:MAG: oligosaccharide flippase family protein [bacterium]|nr:oligosaccharide flippase family protein [bacterium]
MGGYATAVSVALAFLLLSDLGLSPRLVRDASADPEQAVALFRESLGLKLILLVPAALAIIAGGLWLPYPAELRQLVVLMGLAAILQSFGQLNEALLRSRETMHWEALGALLQSLLTTLLALVAIGLGFSLFWVGVARILGAAANLALSSFVVRRDLRPRMPADALPTLRSALPYMATASMNLAYGQIDVALLSLVATQNQVGEYAMISRIVLVAGTFASTGAASFLPALARSFTTAAANFRRMAGTAVGVAAGLGAFGSAALAFLGPWLLVVAYGEGFATLEPLFLAATAYVLFRFLSAALGLVLTASGRQSARARSIFIGLIATLVLVLGCVPIWGVAGAVGALVGSEMILVACLVASTVPLLRELPDPMR